MRLVLLFTRNTSLHEWLEKGIFDREKQIYERHLMDETLTTVVWLTYGSRDAKIAENLYLDGRLHPRIVVKGRPRWFPGGRLAGWLYSIATPFLHWRTLRDCDLLKTNQLDGGWAAVIARYLSCRPLLLRCGYVQSKLERSLRRLPRWRLLLMLALERLQYRHADFAVVTSQHNAGYVLETHRISKKKLRVIPNYIDETLFVPVPDEAREDRFARVLYVGRFSPEKNLSALIRAADMAKLPLDLVGSGPEEELLRALAAKLSANVRFLGKVPNDDLPQLINRYRFFALVSCFEGMPKTLLEALACGTLCIGTNVDGINEVILDGVNGFLANGIDADAIFAALERARQADAISIGLAARESILNCYTLAEVARQERELFKLLLR